MWASFKAWFTWRVRACLSMGIASGLVVYAPAGTSRAWIVLFAAMMGFYLCELLTRGPAEQWKRLTEQSLVALRQAEALIQGRLSKKQEGEAK